MKQWFRSGFKSHKGEGAVITSHFSRVKPGSQHKMPGLPKLAKTEGDKTSPEQPL